MRLFANILQDAHFAVRMGRRNFGFTASAVLLLSVGVGGTTAIFSVVKAVLMDQLPYRNPDRVMYLSEVSAAGDISDGVGGWTANEWRTRSRSFESISLYGDASRVLVENGQAEVLRGLRVSHDFFETLGVSLFLGRSFQAEDDRWPRNNVVILTYGLWMRRFGGDPHMVGRTLDLSTESYRVIGVLPPEFYPLRMSNPAERPAIFMPLGYDARQASTCRGCFGGNAIGRLKPGIDFRQARAELNSLTREMARDDPSYYGRHPAAFVEPLRSHLVNSMGTALWVLMGAVTLALLIVCANIANLLLARATGRTREIAIRAALGCGAGRLIRQLLTEVLLLSSMGGALAIVLAWQAIAVLKSVAPRELPRLDEVHMDLTVLLFAIGISMLSGLLFGIAPALRAASLHLTSAINHSNSAAGLSRRGGLRSLLVVAEVALAFVLAVGTGLLAKSFLRLTAVDAGFDPHNIFTLTLILTGHNYDRQEAMLEYYRQIREKVGAVPGILGVAMVDNVPLSHTSPAQLRIEGAPSVSDSDATTADVFWASDDYFRVLKIPLKRGRFFTAQDGVGGPPIAIISESLAKSRFPGSAAMGKRIQLGPQQDHGTWLTIVGIVSDVRNIGFDHAPDEAIYLPHATNYAHYTRLLVRTAGAPMSFEQPIRAAIREVDPLQAVFHVQSMDDYVASSLAYRSFTLTLIGLFGVLAVLLAGMGVYAVISYVVGLRTREVGIRMALGAERSAILKMVLRDVLSLLAWGLAAGFLCALVLTRFLSHLLFEVRPNDLAISAAVVCVLTCVALLAGIFPAHRAATVDPTQALRAD